jgi:hypothetical protein
MNSHYDQIEATGAPPRRSLLSLLIIPLIAFVAGIAAMGWLLTQWTGGAALLGVAPRTPVSAPPAAAPRQVVTVPAPSPLAAGEPQRLVIDPEISRRVARLETRVTAIDDQARAAVGNADRAEGLLVAFAARRALDRGVALGYIEGLLRQRFADTQPQAVATIISAARQPVTLQQLQEGLQDVAPSLLGGSPDDSWWDSFRRELGGLITVRKAGTPSTVPAERLKRATRRLDAGEVDVALAEVLRMPGRQYAVDWITMARRYVSARRALDTIETAALLEPRVQAGGPVPADPGVTPIGTGAATP